VALKITPYHEEDDEPNENAPVTPPAPQPPAGPPALPSKRPAVPRELLSARPAMTKVVPRSPDSVQAASQATGKPAAPKQLTPEEAAERQQRIDYLKSLRSQGKDRSGGSKKWLVVLIIVLLVVAVGLGAAYWFINRDKAAPAAKHTTTSKPTQTTQQTAPKADADFKAYTSTNFSLSLKYPSDWTLNDAANGLTIISPMQQLPGNAGAPVSGAVVVAIRPQQTTLAEFKTGNAVAVMDSKNVNYSSPAQGQRATTFLSYLQYNTTTTKGALDSLYVTGNAGYKKDQAIPMADVIKVNPLINVYFVQCSSACTPTSNTMNVSAASWASSQLNTTVETILTSLSLS
jgi:cytoskeletal protein RodZ